MTKPTYERTRSGAHPKQRKSTRTVPEILDRVAVYLPGVESFRNYEWTEAAAQSNLAKLLSGALSTGVQP